MKTAPVTPDSDDLLRRAAVHEPRQAGEVEESGYVERRRDPTDRRRHFVEMTPAGERALEHAEVKLETIEDQVVGNLSASERSALRDLLAKAFEGAEAEQT
jgi:DNA-binding MarR family transcriptional regulator